MFHLMKGYNFVLLGVGYVAQKHLHAIMANGGNLVAACDPHDSAGILDRFFPDARFFTDFERFDRFIDLIRSKGFRVNFVSICSPNHLHDSHCRFAMRIGAVPICEKPLTLRTRNLSLLKSAEQRTGVRVNTILQLRLNDQVRKLEKQAGRMNGVREVRIHYSTPRGSWYHSSWKGDIRKSGGVITNIGIHLIDLAVYLYGKCSRVRLTEYSNETVAGVLQLEKASVEFYLTIDRKTPAKRIFEVDRWTVDLSSNFTELHDAAYSEIIAGRGPGIDDIFEATRICEQINQKGQKWTRSRYRLV